MGYEVTYSFHEEISKGEYNKEELKTKTVKVGSPYDEIPLEVVAGKVMAQLARRNILVVDVEIFEFTKKKISYKEAPDGILIKNKKFSFDEGEIIGNFAAGVEVDEENKNNQNQLLQQLLANPQLLSLLQGNQNNQLIQNQPAQQNNQVTNFNRNVPAVASVNIASQSIIRYEIFNPIDKIFLEDAKKRNLPFTLGKKYPVFAERKARSEMVGMLYTIMDDNGKKQVMSDKFFTPDVVLDGEQEAFRAAADNKVSGDGLDWSSFTDNDVPNIR